MWNLTKNQAVKLKEVMQYNLQTVRAYLLKEEFHQFWDYRSVGWAFSEELDDTGAAVSFGADEESGPYIAGA